MANMPPPRPPGYSPRRRAKLVCPYCGNIALAYSDTGIGTALCPVCGRPLKLYNPPKKGTSPEDAADFKSRKNVAVIYGHDSEAANAVFDWLRSIGLRPYEWQQMIRATDSSSPYIGQVLDQVFRGAQAVVVLLTPDELVTSRGSAQDTERFQARPNVLIEAGMALATHPARTVLVILGDQEVPSDLAGRHYIKLDGTPRPLVELASLLERAGCEVDRDGTQWLDTSQFPGLTQSDD